MRKCLRAVQGTIVFGGFLAIAPFVLNGCDKEQAKDTPKLLEPAPVPTQTPRLPRPIVFYLYLPQPDGGLKVLKELDTSQPARIYHELEESVRAADEALRRVLRKTPASFPPGTRMISPFVCDGGRPTINLNRAFRDARWWQDEKRGRAALLALTNTAVETKEATHSSSDDESLRFLIEGKPVDRIGPFTLRESALESDYLTVTNGDVVTKYH